MLTPCPVCTAIRLIATTILCSFTRTSCLPPPSRSRIRQEFTMVRLGHGASLGLGDLDGLLRSPSHESSLKPLHAPAQLRHVARPGAPAGNVRLDASDTSFAVPSRRARRMHTRWRARAVHALVRRIGRVQARRPRSLSRNFRQPSREDDGAQGGGGDRAQRGEPELDGESRGLSATKQRKRGARKGKTAATPAVTLACSATS
jgi:hypothetical protein